MSRPMHGLGFTSPQELSRHVHAAQSRPFSQPETAPPWGCPGPSVDSLLALMGDGDLAHMARLVLDRAPDEMRVIVDLIVRIQSERRPETGHRDPGGAGSAAAS